MVRTAFQAIIAAYGLHCSSDAFGAAIAQAGRIRTAVGDGRPATPYRINPGDELEVLVWGDERLQRSVLVLPDGTFAFPLVGQVNAAGRLPSRARARIIGGLQPQYKGPVLR